jgi:hypothetical protein
MSAPEDHDYTLPTPLADKVRLIAAHLIEDCRLAVAYEEMLLDVACKIAAFESRDDRTELIAGQVAGNLSRNRKTP